MASRIAVSGPLSPEETAAFAAIAILNYAAAPPGHRAAARAVLDRALDTLGPDRLTELHGDVMAPCEWDAGAVWSMAEVAA